MKRQRYQKPTFSSFEKDSEEHSLSLSLSLIKVGDQLLSFSRTTTTTTTRR
jgi:hypothetical protein